MDPVKFALGDRVIVKARCLPVGNGTYAIEASDGWFSFDSEEEALDALRIARDRERFCKILESVVELMGHGIFPLGLQETKELAQSKALEIFKFGAPPSPDKTRKKWKRS